MPKIQKEIWTIGHSTHPLEVFVEMLRSFEIDVVADIRSFPGSRRYPHFNKENLGVSLPQHGFEYVHLIELGGRRKVRPDSVNAGWRHPAFRGYADYMETPDFTAAVEKLTAIAQKKRVAYMCSEAVWWRCHRRMVSDYLKLHHWKVLHIMGEGKSQEHPLTPPAKIVNGNLLYH
jgi:uncharacterized protein (DUF488 family)